MKLNQLNINDSINQRHKQIEQELQGYWKSDRWDPIECPLYTSETNINKQFIKFNIALNSRITNELKYYFFKRLTESVLKMETVWRRSPAINRL